MIRIIIVLAADNNTCQSKWLAGVTNYNTQTFLKRHALVFELDSLDFDGSVCLYKIYALVVELSLNNLYIRVYAGKFSSQTGLKCRTRGSREYCKRARGGSCPVPTETGMHHKGRGNTDLVKYL